MIGVRGDPKSAAKSAFEHKTPRRVQKGGLTPSLLSLHCAQNAALRLPLRRAGLISAARECRR